LLLKILDFHPSISHTQHGETHMSRSVSLRYLAQKLLVAANEAASAVQGSAATSVSDALARGLKAFNCQLTAVGIVTGAAMAPTLNAAVSSSPHATERFLMRRIPHAAPHKTVFEGDVIAFTSPLAVPGVDGSGNHVLVRRVAALEGDELIAGDENDPEESRVVPKASWFTHKQASIYGTFVGLLTKSRRFFFSALWIRKIMPSFLVFFLDLIGEAVTLP
jgi:hypothetical protein